MKLYAFSYYNEVWWIHCRQKIYNLHASNIDECLPMVDSLEILCIVPENVSSSCFYLSNNLLCNDANHGFIVVLATCQLSS